MTGKKVIKDIFADEKELRKQLVEEVVDEPLSQVYSIVEFNNMTGMQDALLFEERRAVQQKKLSEKIEEASM